MGTHVEARFARCASRVAEVLRARGESAACPARDLEASLGERLASARTPSEAWHLGSRLLLEVSAPFEAHAELYAMLAEHVDAGLLPAWTPAPEQPCNLSRLMRRLGVANYAELHSWSVLNPDAYWTATLDALNLRFESPPRLIRGAPNNPEDPRWLEGAHLNVARACLEGPEQNVALLTRDRDQVTIHTRAELSGAVRRAVAGLRSLGISAHDRVALAVPLGFDAVAAYLALLYVGAVVVCIAESYSEREIEVRLEITRPKWLLVARTVRRGGRQLPLYDKFSRVNAPRAIVVDDDAVSHGETAALRSGDVTWRALLEASVEVEAGDAFPMPIDAPNTILFSSGTTGTPKAIPWTPACAIKAAADAKWHLDVRSGDRLMWPTSLGWMMGAWSIFATLLNDAALVVFDDVPTQREFGQFAHAAGVTHLGVVPTLVRSWKESRVMVGLDLRCVRVFSSTGECSNPGDMLYLMWLAHYKPVVEYCGGTEIAGGYITGNVLSPCVPSCFSTPALGQAFECFDDAGEPTDTGEAFLTTPSIGLSTCLLNKDHHEEYYANVPRPGLRRHGDLIQRVNGGYYRVLGRADDTMNLGGIKVSSADIERACQDAPFVREVAAIAVPPPGGGPSALVLCVVTGVELPASVAQGAPSTTQPDGVQLLSELQRRVRERVNPLFKVERVVVFDALPRTASNKVMRRVLRSRCAELATSSSKPVERIVS